MAEDAREIEALAARTIALGSQSFASAARLFDRRTRGGAILLYAWCRHCDDVVDDQRLGHAAPAGAETPAARLAMLEAETRRAFGPEDVEEPVFRALQLVARRHAIPLSDALVHLGGFRMDVEERHYAGLEDTLDYCHHVAGIVGVMMARIMGAADPAVLRRAADLGLAFQLTNIARDIVPDAHAGRIYLPADWLAEAGLAPEDVVRPQARTRLAPLARRLVEAAEPYYASARIGIDALPRRSAWAIATALGVYRAIGLKVVQKGPEAWQARVATSRADKLAHIARGAAAAFGRRHSTGVERPAALWSRV